MSRNLIVTLALCLIAALIPCALADAQIESEDGIFSQAVEPEATIARTGSEESGLSVEMDAIGPVKPEGTGSALPAEIDMDADAAQEILAAASEDGAEEALPVPQSSWADVVWSREPRGDECFSIDADAAYEDLFAGYAKRLFRGDSGIPMATENAGARLTGQDRVIYDALKPEILKVAAGRRASTLFEVPFSALGLSTRFSATDLGVQMSYNDDGSPRADCVDAMWTAYQGLFTYNLYVVSTALWYDCTYELYWLDRYQSSTSQWLQPANLAFDNELGQYAISLPENAAVTIGFPVLEMYAAEPWQVDASLIHGAEQAAENARGIVDRYAGYTDYAKMFGYAVEICKLVDYNHAALEDGWDNREQNPWKLIWVFDGNPDTNVVCEGFTQAFQYLCELTRFDGDIRCWQVDGVANGGSHAWNIVRMDDGNNYMVDITWMDSELENCGTGESLAACIGEGKGSLFLVGAESGSVSDGYMVRVRGSAGVSAQYAYPSQSRGRAPAVERKEGDVTQRVYSAETRAAYDNSTLTLANKHYMLPGFQKIAGKTYSYDAQGRLERDTVKTEGGVNYRVNSDGTVEAGWSEGWHTIDGKEYYFDSKGLHVEHTVVADKGVEPTCTEAGLSDGSHCGVCKIVIEAQKELPALGHDWGETTYVWSLDNSRVTATRVCNRDSGHIETETVNTVSQVGAMPGCETWGETTWTAVFTNAAFQPQQKSLADLVPAGHMPAVMPAVAATDTNPGLTEGRKCLVCGKVLQEQTVVPKLAMDVHITKDKSMDVLLGTKLQIVVDGKKVKSYKSGDSKIAKVSSKGLLTLRKQGATEITISLKSGKNLKLKLYVGDENAPKSVRIKKKRSTVKVGKSLNLTAVLTPADAVTKLRWVSSNRKVATVSSKGVVKGKMPGTVKITVFTSNGKSHSVKIKVK